MYSRYRHPCLQAQRKSGQTLYHAANGRNSGVHSRAEAARAVEAVEAVEAECRAPEREVHLETEEQVQGGGQGATHLEPYHKVDERASCLSVHSSP
jgi:hypothetical protein